MRRLLVTGASGFIGRHCLKPALDRGFEIHAVSSRPVGAVSLDLGPMRWHQVDLLVPEQITAVMREVRPSHVLHAAWETTHGSYWTSPANANWLRQGHVLSKAFADYGGERLVSVGTCAEYDWAHGVLLEGATPDSPKTYYGQMKLAHHDGLMSSAEASGFSAASGRVFFGYGAFENPSRLIPYLCRQLLRSETATVSSSGLKRDFMHVEDVGRGLVALLDSELTGICNIAFGEPTLLGTIAMELGRISGRPDLIVLGDKAGGDEPPLIVGDNSKLKSTGWKPEIQLAEGVARTYAWWASQLAA